MVLAVPCVSLGWQVLLLIHWKLDSLALPILSAKESAEESTWRQLCSYTWIRVIISMFLDLCLIYFFLATVVGPTLLHFIMLRVAIVGGAWSIVYAHWSVLTYLGRTIRLATLFNQPQFPLFIIS